MQSLRESLKPLRSRFRSLEIVAPPSSSFASSFLYLRRQKLIARISLSFFFEIQATLSMLIFSGFLKGDNTDFDILDKRREALRRQVFIKRGRVDE